MGPGVGIHTDDEGVQVGDNGAHAIRVPLHETGRCSRSLRTGAVSGRDHFEAEL
jgi:hypothetical protein